MIGVAMMGVAIVAMLTTMTRATETTQFSSERNDSLDQLRVMTANFSKDLRQGIQATSISSSAMTFQTYVDGTVQTVTWDVVTTSGDERFERTVGAGSPTVYVVKLTTPYVFDYFGTVDPKQVTRVRLALATQPDVRHPAVEVATVVEMRNVP
jgi:hypothetical protein